jgi:glucose-6-phosphate dehydrogenase assembly protein OpcA
VIVDLPGTSSSAVARTLVDLRSRYGAVALGRVLTLVTLAQGADVEASIAAANHASHEHPLRVIVVQRSGAEDEAAAGHTSQAWQDPHLDAQVRVGGDAGASDVVLLRAGPALTEDVSSLVTPLLLPDAPIVAWWPGHAPATTADTSIGAMASRRITDAVACRDPLVAIRDRADAYRPGDGDLAWARLTLWRAALAGALDVVGTHGEPPGVRGVEVHGSSTSPSVDLLGAWLAWALRSSSQVRRVPGHGVAGVRVSFTEGDDLVLERPADATLAHLSIPGRPTRPVALPPRSTEDCLAEELRRLEPDEVYGEVLRRGLPRVIPA